MESTYIRINCLSHHIHARSLGGREHIHPNGLCLAASRPQAGRGQPVFATGGLPFDVNLVMGPGVRIRTNQFARGMNRYCHCKDFNGHVVMHAQGRTPRHRPQSRQHQRYSPCVRPYAGHPKSGGLFLPVGATHTGRPWGRPVRALPLLGRTGPPAMCGKMPPEGWPPPSVPTRCKAPCSTSRKRSHALRDHRTAGRHRPWSKSPLPASGPLAPLLPCMRRGS